MKTSTRRAQVDEQSLRTFENRVRQVLMSSGADSASELEVRVEGPVRASRGGFMLSRRFRDMTHAGLPRDHPQDL